MKMAKFNNWIYLVIYRKSPDDMPDMVFSSTFWFHINASVVKCPSAAIFICSRVQVIFSASRFTSYQLSSYQPVQRMEWMGVIRDTQTKKKKRNARKRNARKQNAKINKSQKNCIRLMIEEEKHIKTKIKTTETKDFGEPKKKKLFSSAVTKVMQMCCTMFMII